MNQIYEQSVDVLKIWNIFFYFWFSVEIFLIFSTEIFKFIIRIVILGCLSSEFTPPPRFPGFILLLHCSCNIFINLLISFNWIFLNIYRIHISISQIAAVDRLEMSVCLDNCLYNRLALVVSLQERIKLNHEQIQFLVVIPIRVFCIEKLME